MFILSKKVNRSQKLSFLVSANELYIVRCFGRAACLVRHSAVVVVLIVLVIVDLCIDHVMTRCRHVRVHPFVVQTEDICTCASPP